jgi:hypothetical protein
MAVLALLYHDIVQRADRHQSGFQGADADIYKLEPEVFASHLQAMASVSSFQISEAGDIRTPHFERVYITFDDGGAGTMLAAELLERLGLRGYFMIVTDLIGKAGFLTESEILVLHQRGHHIGSHSCSHPTPISRCTTTELQHEWRDSIRRLCGMLGTDVSVASVPSGFYSPAVGVEASRAGIRTLFTSDPRVSTRRVEQCTVVGRFCVQEGISCEWLQSLVGGAPFPRWKKYLWWELKKPLKALGGDTWLSARRKILAARAQKAG